MQKHKKTNEASVISFDPSFTGVQWTVMVRKIICRLFENLHDNVSLSKALSTPRKCIDLLL